MKMDFDFTEIAAMARAYQGGDDIVREELKTGMTRTVIQVEADAKRLVPTDTHTLQRSMTHEVTDLGNVITGRSGTNLPYAAAVEDGRGAGEPMPPPGALLGWMERHGIDPWSGSFNGNLATYNLAYTPTEFLVARSIARKGIKGRPYLKPAFLANLPAIRREFGTAVPQRIFRRLAVSRG